MLDWAFYPQSPVAVYIGQCVPLRNAGFDWRMKRNNLSTPFRQLAFAPRRIAAIVALVTKTK
jgi:hypothetical protein